VLHFNCKADCLFVLLLLVTIQTTVIICQQKVVVVLILTLIAAWLEQLRMARRKMYRIQLCLKRFANW